MKHWIYCELRRAFTGANFWIATLLGMVLSIWHYMAQVLPAYPDHAAVAAVLDAGGYPSLFNQWIGMRLDTVQGYLFFLLLPLLATLPFGVSFAQERKSGFLRNLLLCTPHKRDYYVAKLTAVFLSAGTAVTVPLWTNFLLTASSVPALIPISYGHHFSVFSDSMWAELFYTHPLWYTVAYLILIFVFSGLLAQIALCVSAFTTNWLAPLFAPLLCYLFGEAFCSAGGIHNFSPFCFLPPEQIVFGISFYMIAGEAAVLILLAFTLFLRKEAQNDVL